MKKVIILFSIVVLFLTGCQNVEDKGTFSIEPIKPEQNETIIVKFLGDGTKLAESSSVKMLLYQYDVDLLSTTEIAMKKEAQGWTAVFTPSADTKGIIITFQDDKGNIENNESNGFIIYLNDNNGNPLPEALAGYTVALSQWGKWYLELDSDNDSTSLKFENLFKKYPEIKDSYLDFYLYTLSRIGTDSAMSKLSNELNSITSKDSISENEYVVLAKYSGKIGLKEDSKKYDNIILEKYHENKYASEIIYKELTNSVSTKEIKNKFSHFYAAHPNSELVEISTYRVIKKFIDNKDVKGVIKTAKEFGSITHPYAYIYSVNKLIGQNNFKDALVLASMGANVTRENVASPKSIQPRQLSKAAWEKERKDYLAEILKLEAIVYKKLDNKEFALKAAEEAQEIYDGSDIELNELYTSLLVGLKEFKKAQVKIEKYLSDNKSSSAMLDYLGTAYTEINGNSDGYDEYVAKYSDAGNAKLIAKLKEEMIDVPAPDFELNDINGKLVKLSDLKGKTVVVDFWATWCGPCKRSFPAMQKVNDLFINDKNVKFLFINTWEKVDDKVGNAKKFIKKNKYKLTVLMDIRNEVINSFKVSGIPTKFIIGPDQHIKFKSVGFAGTNEELVKEVSAMIKLTK